MASRFNPLARNAAPPAKRGRLKIFLGYASGVGKTYRMLDEARRRKERGEDVVVAAHQAGTHAENRTLLDKLEIIPILKTSLGESIHMDAVLKRRPEVCVIDPLAHNNPAGFANRKRWQDVDQLLENGISVLTSINLLHIEELRPRVEALTGKHTQQTVPKDFLARADEIVIVDVSTDLALERAGEDSGLPGISQEAGRRLAELREMALVLAAEVVDRQLENYLDAHGIRPALGVHERILVCLTPSSNAEAMLASGVRNRDRFHGDLFVVYVRQARLTSEKRERIDSFLEAARNAGATVSTLKGADAISAILEYARQHKITQIFVGHSKRAGLLNRLTPSPLDRLLRGAEQIDVRIFPQ